MWSAELERGHVALALVVDYAVSCDAVPSFRDPPARLLCRGLREALSSLGKQDQ